MNPPLHASTTCLTAQLPAGVDPVAMVATIHFEGRRIWTFRITEEHWVTPALTVPWPPALIPHLSGTTTVSLMLDGVADLALETTVRFGDGDECLSLKDPLTGTDLVINKWGRLAKSFESAPTGAQTDVLRSAAQLIELLRAELGLNAFITGGTLLGLVRDGRLINSDDDADLAYLSRHENPSDVVLESYEVERILVKNGFEIVRHTSGHLQVMFGGSDFTDGYYVDIFTYFVTNGWFYGTFHAREHADKVAVLPTSSLEHDGVILPIPANSDQMLTAIYGANWPTPDPAFTFETPDAAGRRFYWWLNHFDPFREDWEDFHRGIISQGSPVAPSTLAEWLSLDLPATSTVLELGCGLGADAHALAAAGHKVLAVDYSRPGVKYASTTFGEAAKHPDGSAQFEVANINSVRHMAAIAHAAAQLAGPEQPVTVIARNLFDNLHYLGRDNALLTISHLLTRGGRAYLQVRNPKAGTSGRDPLEPLGERIFDPWEFAERLSFYGLEIVQQNFIQEPGPAGTSLSYILGKVSST